jgi:4-hydroxybenzoate polyprenyltransferase
MALDAAAYSLHTIYLFTVQDFVTCLLPVVSTLLVRKTDISKPAFQTAFACIAGPVSSPSAFVHALLWHYAHLLHCNLANQYNGREEDAVNKPWRPIAAGRISVSSAFWLRWALPVVCIALSAMYGERLVMTSLALTVVTVLYDEMAFSSVWFT